MSNLPLELVRPEVIFGTGGSDEDEVNGPLDPCPSCGSRPHEAPEGIHDVHTVRKYPGTQPGDPKWNFEHCWKCGYRPGHNVAISQSELRRQFAQFKSWMDAQLPQPNERGIAPPANDSDIQQLKDALAAAQERELVLRSQLEGNDGNSTK